MATALPTLPGFSVDSDPQSVSTRWTRWLSRLENLFVAMNITDTKRQRALLLYYAGEEVHSIFDTLENTGDDYKTAKEHLTTYFSPRKNTEYERYVFRQAKQHTDESIDRFQKRLRQLASTCEFADTDQEIKSQIILNCSSSKLRRVALRDTTLTLQRLQDLGRAMEQSETQAVAMGTQAKPTETVNKVGYHTQRRKNTQRGYSRNNFQQQSSRNSTCNHCGGSWPHKGGMENCPARGKKCRMCGILNHFDKCCRSNELKQNKPPTRNTGPPKKSQVNSIQPKPTTRYYNIDSSSSDEEYIYSVQTKSPKLSSVNLSINQVPVKMLLDTSASINIIGKSTYERLQSVVDLQPTNLQIFPYASSSTLALRGKFDAIVDSTHNVATATFYVAEDSDESLLSYSTAKKLELIQILHKVDVLHSPVMTPISSC